MPAGEGTRWHKLEGTTERYLILHGSGEVYVGDFVRAVEPGDVVLIPAGAAQKIRNTGSEALVFLALCTPRFERGCYRDLAARESVDR